MKRKEKKFANDTSATFSTVETAFDIWGTNNTLEPKCAWRSPRLIGIPTALLAGPSEVARLPRTCRKGRKEEGTEERSGEKMRERDERMQVLRTKGTYQGKAHGDRGADFDWWRSEVARHCATGIS